MESKTGIVSKLDLYGNVFIGNERYSYYKGELPKVGDEIEITFERKVSQKSNKPYCLLQTCKVIKANTGTLEPAKTNADFRDNVDAGNNTKLQIELLNNCPDLTFAEKFAIIKEGSLLKAICNNFETAKIFKNIKQEEINEEGEYK